MATDTAADVAVDVTAVIDRCCCLYWCQHAAGVRLGIPRSLMLLVAVLVKQAMLMPQCIDTAATALQPAGANRCAHHMTSER